MRRIVYAVVLGLTCAAPAVAAEDRSGAADVEPILVKGSPREGGFLGDSLTVAPDGGAEATPDTANLIERVPGGAVSDNGPISGQVNYRGMFGPRMNVRIDGMYVNPGGPNWMDPPLHYTRVEMSAGRADGNNYVGDVALEPEVSHEIGLGLDWRTGRAYATPRLFYRDVDDYIQGVSFDDTPGAPFDSDVERVSNANHDPATADPRTAGYGLFNVGGRWRPAAHLRFDFGVDNVFDKTYRDHLSGFNRVADSDVADGERLPGPGVNAFLRVAWTLGAG